MSDKALLKALGYNIFDESTDILQGSKMMTSRAHLEEQFEELVEENERLTAERSDLLDILANGKGVSPDTYADRVGAALVLLNKDSCKHEWCDIAAGGQYCRLCDSRKERTEDIFIDDGGMAYDE